MSTSDIPEEECNDIETELEECIVARKQWCDKAMEAARRVQQLQSDLAASLSREQKLREGIEAALEEMILSNYKEAYNKLHFALQSNGSTPGEEINK